MSSEGETRLVSFKVHDLNLASGERSLVNPQYQKVSFSPLTKNNNIDRNTKHKANHSRKPQLFWIINYFNKQPRHYTSVWFCRRYPDLRCNLFWHLGYPLLKTRARGLALLGLDLGLGGHRLGRDILLIVWIFAEIVRGLFVFFLLLIFLCSLLIVVFLLLFRIVVCLIRL